MPEKQPMMNDGGATGAPYGEAVAYSASVHNGLMSPIPPTNLVTAIRVATSLFTECSMRRFAPTLALIDSIIASSITACGITAAFSSTGMSPIVKVI
jgi:hypothetical protein